jgi:hypothetical protein
MISTQAPKGGETCAGCAGKKQQPIAALVYIGDPVWLHESQTFAEVISFALCEECGRDAANAIGFMCVRDGGWSTIAPRKRKGKA